MGRGGAAAAMGLPAARRWRAGRGGSRAAQQAAVATASGFAVVLLLLWLRVHEAHGTAGAIGGGGALPGLEGFDPATAFDPASAIATRASVAAAARAQHGSPGRDTGYARRPQEEQYAMAGAAAALPSQQQAGQAQALRGLFLTFGNEAYLDLALNWAEGARRIGAPYRIAGEALGTAAQPAFDDGLMAQCHQRGLHCIRVQLNGTTGGDFRSDAAAFRAMGEAKVRFVLRMLEEHPQLLLVVVSDTDAAWLAPPWRYFEQRPAADFFVSTDCLSHQLEDEWRPNHDQPRCGHIPPINFGLLALNTGLFAARNTPAARQLLRRWAGMLGDPRRERADDPEARYIDDQLAFNTLVEEGGLAGSPDNPRLLTTFNGSLRIQPLPVLLFSGGHVAFVQRLPWKHGVSPYVVHATFQRYATPGRVARFREFGLWHLDPPAYYGAAAVGAAGGDGGGASGSPLQLLAYDNGVQAFVAAQEAARYPGARMPLFEKHWLAAAYQLAAFRDALAAARMLGRALLLPTFICYCDIDEHPHILMRCRIKGTDYRQPFECPLDFLLAPDALEQRKVAYRPAGFLRLPQVPAALRRSSAVLRIAAARPAAPFPPAQHLLGHAATLWPGIQQQELRQVVEPVRSAAVLVLRGEVPGFLGGFGTGGEAAAAAFDELYTAVTEPAAWCCSTWGPADEEYRSFPFARPPPLADPWRKWEPPVLLRPPWCDLVSEQDGNRNFTRLPQHPCAFVGNPAVAALAADDTGEYNSG